METSVKTEVFKRAHVLMEQTGKSFPVCLARSWALRRLTDQMSRGVVSFAYERADGSLRKAKGTLRDVEYLIKGTGRENYKTVRYYDLDARGFRSFKVENFITTY